MPICGTSVHRQVGVQPEFGLIDYLKDPQTASHAMRLTHADTDTEFGAGVGAGPVPNVTTDQLISSSTFRCRILQERKRGFSILSVVDTFALLPVVRCDVILPIKRCGGDAGALTHHQPGRSAQRCAGIGRKAMSQMRISTPF